MGNYAVHIFWVSDNNIFSESEWNRFLRTTMIFFWPMMISAFSHFGFPRLINLEVLDNMVS